jgi:hypothetical protein
MAQMTGVISGWNQSLEMVSPSKVSRCVLLDTDIGVEVGSAVLVFVVDIEAVLSGALQVPAFQSLLDEVGD